MTPAARELSIAPSTLLRWLDDGFVAGEQITPGAPWQIRLTAELRGMLTDDAPDGWLPLTTPPRRSASPARPYCRRSSAASCAPS